MAASNKPQITEWFSYADSETTAKVLLRGTGFGPTPGSVNLISQSGGVLKNVTVRLWTDTLVIAEAPIGVTLKRAFLDLPKTSRKGTVRAESPASLNAYTALPEVPSFTVTEVSASIEELRIAGTDLDTVDTVYLADSSDIPTLIEPGVFHQDGDDLVVQWPASFPESYVGRIILADTSATPYSVESLTEGYRPEEPTPIATSVLVDRTGSGNVTLTILGRGFGSERGTVRTRRNSGLFGGDEDRAWSTEHVLVGGWSDTSIVSSGPSGVEIDSLEVKTASDVLAELDPSITIPFTTPGGIPAINSVSQYGSLPTPGGAQPYSFRFSGTDLADIARLVFQYRKDYDPAPGSDNDSFTVWNVDFMGDSFSDFNLPQLTINEWSGTLIDITFEHDFKTGYQAAYITGYRSSDEYLALIPSATASGLLTPIS